MRKLILLIVILGMVRISFSQENKYLPIGGDYQLVSHTYYNLGYSEKHEQAAWVAYELWNLEINGNYSRTDNFRKDKMILTGSADLSDYKGSGYDRGHLAPAGDMTFSKTAMSESFYLSNMSPQLASFNRGIWKDLESHVRIMALAYGKVYVVTGGVLNDDIDEFIGKNEVAIPKIFYKALYCESSNQAVAFILPHKDLKGKSFLDYAFTIDSLESLLNLDLYSQINDSNEASIEANIDLFSWTGDEKYQPNSSSYDNKSSNSIKYDAVQCEGIAKSTGVRCLKKTTNSNKHCHYHQSQAQSNNSIPKVQYSSPGRCTATTKAGSRCKRTAASGSSRCWQH